MAMRKRSGVRRRAAAKRAADSKSLSRVERTEVRKMITGTAETKSTAWYETRNNGTVPDKATGFWTVAGFAGQSNRITTNNTDILRLIPTVTEGTDAFERIGRRIRVQSLKVNGAVRITMDKITPQQPLDVRVVIYVLQHVNLKDYASLYARNDFNQLLDNQEGGTNQFYGLQMNEFQRVNNSFYKLCAKKVVTLRYAGTKNPADQTAAYSIANAHNYYATYSFDVTKHLPKVLTYPDGLNGGSVVDPVVLNAPTNSSLFMCMGWIDQQGPYDFVNSASIGIENHYVSNLLFKDT